MYFCPRSLLMVYFVLFSIAELCFGVMISTLFNSAKVAAIVGPLAHFAFTMPRYIFTRTGALLSRCLVLHAQPISAVRPLILYFVRREQPTCVVF